jgi:SNF2 family DNA or RNA helicase
LNATTTTSAAAELRRLVQPFLLRRLKSDPTIISDLPEKNEMVVYCSLTQEQATLYESTVHEALTALERADGIQRRGLVLSLLTRSNRFATTRRTISSRKPRCASAVASWNVSPKCWKKRSPWATTH